MSTIATEEEILETAARAFSAGNYQAAREHALRLQKSEDEATRRSADDLLEKMSPAPLGKYLFVLSTLLLLAVTLFAYSK